MRTGSIVVQPVHGGDAILENVDSVTNGTSGLGRVTAFRATLPEGTRRTNEERKTQLQARAPRVENGHLLEPGFMQTAIVENVVATRHVDETDRPVDRFGQAEIIPVPVYTKFFDMMDTQGVGYVLVGGKGDTHEARRLLNIYLESIGVDAAATRAVPLSLNDDEMKTVRNMTDVVLKGIKHDGVTTLSIYTRLPSLEVDADYRVLREHGIEEREWSHFSFIPPTIMASNRRPPNVLLRRNGFTIRSAWDDAATWHYVRWVLDAIEHAQRTPSVLRRRERTLTTYAPETGPLRMSNPGH